MQLPDQGLRLVGVGIRRVLIWFGRGAFLLAATALILCAIGLSGWAVVQAQLMSRPEDDPTRWFYAAIFLLCELWVAIGLTLIVLKLRGQAWLAAAAATVVWVPAVGLSALQESRFHRLMDSEITGAAALTDQQRLNAQARINELEVQLAAITVPSRSLLAVEAELGRYSPFPETYPTRIGQLSAEKADIELYHQLSTELAHHRRTLEVTATSADQGDNAKTLGQRVSVPLGDFALDEESSVWALIIWMMLVKALGPYLLLNWSQPARRSPATKSNTSSEARIVHITTKAGEQRVLRQL